jgi:argininosuccinate synthase
VANKKVVLAYSGGLDTSYCVVYLQERGFDVITVSVDTGGCSVEESAENAERARTLGAVEHHTVDARQEVFDRYVSYLIKGNVLRGQVYPLAVAAERVVQASTVARYALDAGADAVAHGSTGAGNDQVRFDVVFEVLCPGMEIITPVRDERLSRDEEYERLKERGVDIPASVRQYSINAGLWGSTIGGGETHDSWLEIPDKVYDQALGPAAPAEREDVTLQFENGLPVALDGKSMAGPDLITVLGDKCRSHRVGLGIHIGDTVLGIKGRIAFEAGAAIVLINAHRELEKITTTSWQRYWKDQAGEFYGKLLHEGMPFEPALRDIEALIDSSQVRVSGEARVRLDDGHFRVTGVRSPHSMMDARSGVYGELPELWDGRDTRGFAKIAAVSARIHRGVGDEMSEAK